MDDDDVGRQRPLGTRAGLGEPEAGSWALVCLLAIVAAVVLVVLLVRLLSQPHPATADQTRAGGEAAAYPSMPEAQVARPSGVTETPREIVQRRYAAGEIDRDEYLQKLADL